MTTHLDETRPGTAYAWAPITKSVKQDDGTLIVHGPAANATLDRDKQGLDPDWLNTAMPEWFAESGNIREQHDSKRAVGVAVGYTPDGGEHNIAARIVDPVAVAKVEAGVLKGFSVGIKEPILTFADTAFPAGKVIAGKIIEVSVVDRPSNPTTLFTMAKADGADDLADVESPVLEELADAGAGEPTVSEDGGTADDVPPPAVLEVAIPDHIVKSARLKATGEAVLAALGSLDVPARDLAKGDESSDIADAQSAIAAIAALIRSEAVSLAAGQMEDAYDIGTLLDAIRSLAYFIRCEQEQHSEPDGGSVSTAADALLALSDSPDATGGEVPDVTKADALEAPAGAEGFISKAEVPELVKAAVADAVAEATAPLLARLEKVEGLPAPGGPVVRRSAGQKADAVEHDTAQLIAEADAFLAKADAVADSTLAAGYREKAAELKAQAAR